MPGRKPPVSHDDFERRGGYIESRFKARGDSHNVFYAPAADGTFQQEKAIQAASDALENNRHLLVTIDDNALTWAEQMRIGSGSMTTGGSLLRKATRPG